MAMSLPLTQPTPLRAFALRVLLALDRLAVRHARIFPRYRLDPGLKLRIVLIGHAHLGDLLCFFPFLAYVLDKSPLVEWHVVGAPEMAALADSFHLPVRFHGLGKGAGGGGFRYCHEIRKLCQRIPPDAGISYSYDRYHWKHLAQYLARVPQRIGFDDKGFGLFLTSPVTYPPHTTYVEQISRLLASLFDDEVVGQADLVYRRWLGRFGNRAGNRPASARKQLGVCLFGQHSFRWPMANWRTLLNALLDERTDLSVVFVGRQHDVGSRELVTWLQARYGGERVADLMGKTTLTGVLDTMRTLDGLVTQDTGLRHLANLAGLPVVVLRQSESDPARWGRYVSTETVLTAPQPCSPCGLPVCRYDRVHCMEDIPVDRCKDAVRLILNLAL